MITKIVLENFMAHEHTELELGPGVNALTGPNNTGKSAIVEALRCVATNPVPKHYIRHGAKEARVSLEFDDGTKVVWIRTKRSPGYEVWHPGAEEPETYWKFGRKPPEDVLAALRLDLVELETGGEVDVHVGNQREPVFLLNQPGSNAAAFFAASTESAHLLAMQNVLKRRTQDSKRQERELKGRLAEVESKLDQFDTLPDIVVELETAKELESATKDLQSSIPVLENLLSSREKISKELAQCEASSTVLNVITPIPNLSETKDLSRTISLLGEVSTAKGKGEARIDNLSSLQPIPPVHDTLRLATLCSELQSLDIALNKAHKYVAATSSLKTPSECKNTVHLSNIIDEMLVLECRGRRGLRWQKALQKVVEPPEIVGPGHLEMLLADIRGLQEQQSVADASKKELENRLEQLKASIKERVEVLGHCPTCGGEITGDGFLDRRCQHDA